MNSKKMITSILALTMATAVMAVPTFATGITVGTDGDGAEVPVSLTAAAATFSVTVPTSLPINIAADGTITVANDAKIINNGCGSVLVTDVKIEGVDDWEIVDFDSANMSKEKVGSHKVAMQIMNDKTTADDTISFTQANWPAIAGKNDTDTDELLITYDAKVPAQATALTNVSVCNVTFTVGWDTLVANGT